MKEQIIVTLGRECGSGGHYAAQQIAAQLHIQLYDKALINGAVEMSGYSEEMIRKFDEKPVNFLKFRRVGNYSNSLEENVAEKQFEFIRQCAASGQSFVLVGRCGENIFRDNPNAIRIFVQGNHQDKIQRMMQEYHLSEKQAGTRIQDTDRKRKTYHNYYSTIKWGDARGYDLCINSSKLGIDRTIDTLLFYIRAFQEQ